MARHLDGKPTRSLRAGAVAITLLCATALFGCTKRDSIAEIRAQQGRGEFEATIEPLRDLLRERPEDPEVNFLYGHALVSTSRPSLATWALRKAMEHPDWLVPAGTELATAALAGADYNEAVEAANRVLEREPDNVQALIARANAEAYWRKDPEAAIKDAARVLELDPDSVDAMKPRILALLALDRRDDARAAIEELGRRIDEVGGSDASRSWFCVTQAIFTDESGEVKRAREMWTDCLGKYPAVPDVVFSAIGFYDAQQEPQRSIEVLRAALAADPKSQTFRSLLAERLRATGSTAEGEALLMEATNSEDPSVATVAWLEVGRLRRNAQDPGGAADAMGRAYEVARKAGLIAPQLLFEYAEALMLSQQFDRALEIASEIKVPAQQHLIRARVEQERGRFKEALAEYDETFRIWPDNPWARYYAGRAAENAGDFDRAIEEYRTSIRIDGGATDVRTRAGALLFAEGKDRSAAQMLRQPAGQPLDKPGVLLLMRLSGRGGSPQQIGQVRSQLDGWDLPDYAAAIAEIARGLSEGKGGPKSGIEFLRKSSRLDLTAPGAAAALRQLVRLSRANGAKDTPPELQSALAKHPDAASIQAARGLDRELAADPDGARTAYARALELDPDEVQALLGTGRLAPDRGEAVGLFDRAAAADPTDPEPELEAAKAVAATGKVDDAVRRLDALLVKYPLEGRAASLRVDLDLQRGIATDQTLELARRAARLGGGADELDRVGRVLTQRGDTEEANRIAERAKALREKKAASS